MVLTSFEKVVWACYKQRFNAKTLARELTIKSNCIFGGPGGVLQKVIEAQTEDAALFTFCQEWILLRNNDSFLDAFDAALTVRDGDLALLMIDEISRVLNQSADQLNPLETQNMTKRLKQMEELFETQKGQLKWVPSSQTKQPVRFEGDDMLVDDYIARPQLESELRTRVKQLVESATFKILMIHGEGGVGKTSMVRQALDELFLTGLGVCYRVRMNVYELSSKDEFNPDNFYNNLADFFDFERNPNRTVRRCIETFFRSLPGKVLLILDDVFHEQVFHYAKLGDQVRCIVISRRNFLPQLRPLRIISEPDFKIEKMGDDDILQVFPAEYPYLSAASIKLLAKSCNGLPLLAQLISAGLKNIDNSGEAGAFFKQIVGKPSDILSQPSLDFEKAKIESMEKVLMLGFEKQQREFRRQYYAFLLFDEGSSVDICDLAVLWLCKDKFEAAGILKKFVALSLVRTDKSGENHTANIHSYLFGAALKMAMNDKEFVAWRTIPSDNPLPQLRLCLLELVHDDKTGSNVLHLAAEKQRSRLIGIVFNAIRTESTDNELFFKICKQQTKRGRQLPLHTLLRSSDRIDDFALKTACLLADRLLIAGKGSLLTDVKDSRENSVLELLLKLVSSSVNEAWERNPLLVAAGNGCRKLVEKLLDNGADNANEIKDKDGNNVLLIATWYSADADLILDLVRRTSNKIDVNSRNNKGDTALLLSARLNDFSYCKYLLALADIDCDCQNNDGNTALMLAARDGFDSIVSLLLESGANPHLKNNSGHTALSLATMNDRKKCVALISSSKKHETNASADNSSDIRSNNDLISAAINDDFELAKTLLDTGADAINIKNDIEMTALMAAAVNNRYQIAELLIDHGADVNTKRKDEETVLMVASKYGYEKIAKLLIEHGADVNAKDANNWTALILASGNGHGQIARSLIEKGANVNARNKNNETALTVVSICGHAQIATLLIEHGADINAKDKDDITPLIFASNFGNEQIVKLLLELEGIDINTKTSDGVTAVMAASTKGHEQIARMLIEHEANINIKDEDECTALMLAAQSGHIEIARLLYEHGADATTKDKHGMTASTLASQSGHDQIARLLAEHDDQ